MGKHLKDILSKLNNPISDKYITKGKYINRELSWLEFNKRVLSQSIRKDIPLLEKVNFLSITSSNMDEFIMVRFATVINKLIGNRKQDDISGMRPWDEYKAVLEGITNFKEVQEECCELILNKLENNSILITSYDNLDKNEKAYVKKLFYNNIYPLLTPINYDTTKAFPKLVSKQNHIVVALEDKFSNNMQVISFIPLPSDLKKIYKIDGNKNVKYITLEEIVYTFLDRIYYNKKIVEYGCIKVLREADFELEHNEDIYITDRMNRALLERRFGDIIYMDISSGFSKSFVKVLSKILNLKKDHVYINNTFFNYSALTDIEPLNENMKYKKFNPQYPPELIGEHSMFSAIDNDDILIHNPYETYDPVIKFLEHASNDPNVLAIKQTLYRVSSIDSPIVEALCNAARNGKQVSVVLEIKARFDEERNISLIDKMTKSGVQLIFGDELLKTHCKFIVIVRKHKNRLKLYSNISTGNFNEKTAKLYTDISYFTSNFKFGQDLVTVFNILSGYSEPAGEINKLYFSPFNLRSKLNKEIDECIKYAKKGGKAIIGIKVNSISDKEIIDRLYDASKAGVHINVFCRGICSMKPINDRITIKSLIGRYLEHSRIYYFGFGKTSRVYLSSADLLTRNLDKRFELLVPIVSDNSKEKLLKIYSLYYKDTFNSFQMDKYGNYNKIEDKKYINIHEIFMNEAIKNYKLKSIPKLVESMKK